MRNSYQADLFRYVRRIVPIQAASGATLKQLGEIAADVVKKGFQTPDNQALKVRTLCKRKERNGADPRSSPYRSISVTQKR